MNKKWEFAQVNEELVKEIAFHYSISETIAKVILNRGIEKDAQINDFLHPNIDKLYDPFLFNDMDIAVNRILKCKEDNEKVTIYGDYDVDGITSTAILSKFLIELGIENDFYLPNRLSEGYGLNNNAIDKIVQNGTKLLITVDCGISGYNEVEYAKEHGLDVIVTDHHECPEKLPQAIAVIDAKRPDSTYPFNSLAGVGVTFKLIHAISLKLGLDRKSYLKYLDIVCLGTVADIVPLVDENRLIVHFGLMLVKQTKNIGLKSLIEIAGYNESIDSTAISFGLAPRINACGRLGKAEIALKLLLTTSIEEAKKIAIELNNFNKERQEVEKRIINDAMEIIEKDKLYNDDIIVLASENWHHGVIGIVSSKITETYYKPSILISIEDGIGKGSGRSIDGFDLHSALTECSEYLDKFGGHEMAIGLSLDADNIEKFKQKIKEVTSKNIDKEAVPKLKIDALINPKEINFEIFDSMNLLEPYGEANHPPIFVSKNLKVDSVRLLSNDRHLKLTLKGDNILLNAIGFNLGDRVIHIGDRIDVAYMLEVNKFNNMQNIQLNIKDIKKSL
ncbi:MAG: single-stranded-DNA-specific exonuclease RecJ [Clostridia bacterium]|nr:single-stranded-DNA-specific exonuclease RecJ [Clostridia bacterium]